MGRYYSQPVGLGNQPVKKESLFIKEHMGRKTSAKPLRRKEEMHRWRRWP